MDHPISAQAAWVREMQKFSAEVQSRWGARLATWLVIGNAGALVLVFNTIIAGTACDPHGLQAVVWSFAWGLIIAFAGSAINYFVGLYAGVLISRSVRNVNTLEVGIYDLLVHESRSGQPAPDDHPGRTALSNAMASELALQRKVSLIWFGVGASIIVLLISAGFFSRGLLLPVIDHGHLLASCSGA